MKNTPENLKSVLNHYVVGIDSVTDKEYVGLVTKVSLSGFVWIQPNNEDWHKAIHIEKGNVKFMEDL